MEARELRIADVVGFEFNTGSYFMGTVESINKKTVNINCKNKIYTIKYCNVYKLSIDIDIVLKIGFEWYEPLKHYRFVNDKDIWFEVKIKNGKYLFSFWNLRGDETEHMPYIVIDSLHQLQNIMFDLGEELDVSKII